MKITYDDLMPNCHGCPYWEIACCIDNKLGICSMCKLERESRKRKMTNDKKRLEMCIRDKITKRIIGWTVGMTPKEIEDYCQKHNGYLSWYEGIQDERVRRILENAK